MTMWTLTIELPEELVELFGSIEAARAETWEVLILHLLREGEVSQGRAARLLSVTRYDLLDLMVQHQIPAAPRTIEDVQTEVDIIKELARQ